MSNQIPVSLFSEATVLGEIILKPEMLKLASLKPDDFYSPQYAHVFRTMLKLAEHGKSPDPSILMDHGIKPEIVADLSGKVHSIGRFEYHIGIIKDKSALRKMLVIFDKFSTECREGEKTSNEITSEAITVLNQQPNSNIRIYSENELQKGFLEECAKQYEHPNEVLSHGVKTGLKTLDDSLTYSGLPRGQITIIAAQTSKGKSALSQAIKRNAAIDGDSVLVVTLEDTAKAQVRRDFSAESGIQNRRIQRRKIDEDEWRSLISSGQKIRSYGNKINYIEDFPGAIRDLLIFITRYANNNTVDLLIIDYLQLIPAGVEFRAEQQRIDYILDNIIEFSRRQKNIAILLVTQMARHGGPNSRPRLDKLYHSAKLEHAAHTVMMIWSPEVPGWPRPRGGIDATMMIDCKAIDIAKQKDGPTGLRIIGWDGNTVKFYDPDPVDAKAYVSDLKSVKDDQK